MNRGPCGPGLLFDAGLSWLVQLRGLERLHVFEAVDDATADLQVLRALLEPAPALQGARPEAASRQLDLVQVPQVAGYAPCQSRPLTVLPAMHQLDARHGP